MMEFEMIKNTLNKLHGLCGEIEKLHIELHRVKIENDNLRSELSEVKIARGLLSIQVEELRVELHKAVGKGG